MFTAKVKKKSLRQRFLRQLDLVDQPKLSKLSMSLIGAGAIGSFTGLILSKMGISWIEVFDEDGVSEENLPNQMYPPKAVGEFKVDAFTNLITEFSGYRVTPNNYFYDPRCYLKELVVVATDSMASRRLVWDAYKAQKQCKYYIEARMGALFGQVYTIQNKTPRNIKFYEQTLYSDSEVPPVKCTAKSINFNVAMIASLIGRAVRAIVNRERRFPREMQFNMYRLDNQSFTTRE